MDPGKGSAALEKVIVGVSGLRFQVPGCWDSPAVQFRHSVADTFAQLKLIGEMRLGYILEPRVRSYPSAYFKKPTPIARGC